MRFGKLFLIAATFAAFHALPAHAINVTSTDYRIYGDWTDEWQELDANESTPIGPPHITTGNFSYQRTDGLTLSASVASLNNWTSGSATVDSFAIAISANAIPDGYMDAGIVPGAGPVNLDGTAINIYASSETHFRPEGPALTFALTTSAITTYEPLTSGLLVSLTDLTTSLVLFQTSGNLYQYDFGSIVENLAVDPAHEYSLLLYGKVNAYDADDNNLNLQAGFVIVSPPEIPGVPDGGNTVALLGMAVCIIAARQRKCRRS